jgi:hypothetical protein
MPTIEFFLKKVARAGERTRDLLISFIFSFHHLTLSHSGSPQQLNIGFQEKLTMWKKVAPLFVFRI